MTKTRWKIEPDKIIIRPYGLLFVLGGVLTLIYAAIFLGFRGIGQESPLGSGTFGLFLIGILFLFFLGGFTRVVFDRTTGNMQKLLFGFIPVKTIPFEQLHGVNIVTQRTGGYNYRIFTRANKFGKGTIISSGYSKDTDRNAVAFTKEVIPAIHQLLDAQAPLPEQKEEKITSFKHFTEADGVYTLKVNKAGLLVLGFGLLAVGIHECTPAAWITDVNTIGKLIICGFFLACGIAFITRAFTKTSFNTRTRIIEKKSPVGLGSQRHPFEHFINFQTVRRSYNGIYQGTDVHMYFQKSADAKAKAMTVSTFRNTQKIERFMQEIHSIMQ